VSHSQAAPPANCMASACLQVSERLGVLWQLLTSLAGELLAAHAELQQYKLAQGEGVEGGRAWREPHVNAVARRARALDEYREQVSGTRGEGRGGGGQMGAMLLLNM
jgi:hypothetical protein